VIELTVNTHIYLLLMIVCTCCHLRKLRCIDCRLHLNLKADIVLVIHNCWCIKTVCHGKQVLPALHVLTAVSHQVIWYHITSSEFTDLAVRSVQETYRLWWQCCVSHYT